MSLYHRWQSMFRFVLLHHFRVQWYRGARGTIVYLEDSGKVLPGLEFPTRTYGSLTHLLMYWHVPPGFPMQLRVLVCSRHSDLARADSVPRSMYGLHHECPRYDMHLSGFDRSSGSGGTFSFQRPHPRRPHHRAAVAHNSPSHAHFRVCTNSSCGSLVDLRRSG